MLNPNDPPLWSVVAQRHVTDVDPSGNLEDVMEVTARTVSGVTFAVKIPWSQYGVEQVAMALESRAKTIEAVQSL